jgi:heme-degrading monooxygenase HmoA
MDSDPDEIYAVAIAESEPVYRAWSESPEMHQAYEDRLEWMESEPEWHDGTVILFRHHPVPEGAQLYGTVAEMTLKQGALDALMERGDGAGQPTGAVALWVFQMDADPNQVFMVAISESEAAYRAYSESERSNEQYVEMLGSLEGKPEWHDGRVLDYRVWAG